jgi:hypothetical protein
MALMAVNAAIPQKSKQVEPPAALPGSPRSLEQGRILVKGPLIDVFVNQG